MHQRPQPGMPIGWLPSSSKVRSKAELPICIFRPCWFQSPHERRQLFDDGAGVLQVEGGRTVRRPRPPKSTLALRLSTSTVATRRASTSSSRPCCTITATSNRAARAIGLGSVWRRKSRKGGELAFLCFGEAGRWRGPRHHASFFHYAKAGQTKTLATPLFVYETADDEHTFATWLSYVTRSNRARHSPCSALCRPGHRSRANRGAPIFYRSVSPRSSGCDLSAVWPLRAAWLDASGLPPGSSRDERDQLAVECVSLDSWAKATKDVVVARSFGTSSKQTRQTVVFPLFWRFADRQTSMLVGKPTRIETRRRWDGLAVSFLSPVFLWGTPRGHWWNVLYGLAGYTREGTMAKMRLVTSITLSEPQR